MNKKIFVLLVLLLFIFSGCSLTDFGNNIKQVSNSFSSKLPSNRQLVFQEITVIKDIPDFVAQASSFATANWSPDAELESVKVEKDDSIFAYRALFQSANNAVDKNKVATMVVYYNISRSLFNLDPQTAPYYKKSSIDNNSILVGVYDINDEVVPTGPGSIEPSRIRVLVKVISGIYENKVSNDRCQEGDLHFVNDKLEFDWGTYRFDPYSGLELPSESEAALNNSAGSAAKPAVSKPDSPVDLNIDSDHDGLKDSDEVKYGTDPNKADTDGDGYSDGSEVTGGYNPLGSGKMTAEQLKIKNK
jgi:hypothetical protein